MPRKGEKTESLLPISWDTFAITGWMDGFFLNKHAIGGLNNIMSVYRTNAMVLIWLNGL